MLSKLAELRLAIADARWSALAPTIIWTMSLLLLAGCPAEPIDHSQSGNISVRNARVRQLLPGQSKTVAYVDLRNNGPKPVTLLKAHSDHASAIEFHQSTSSGNMMAMRRIESIVIPSQETVRLAPGGLHLMLFGIDELPPSTELQLFWAHGQVLTVPFRRVAIGAQ